MKKLLLLSVVGVFSLSSFTNKIEAKKTLKTNPNEHTVRCADGHYVTFQCGCIDQQDVNDWGSIYCGS